MSDAEQGRDEPTTAQAWARPAAGQPWEPAAPASSVGWGWGPPGEATRPATPGPPRRRRGLVPLLLAALLLVTAGAGAGAGIGHVLWVSSGSAKTAAGAGSGSSGATGGSGSGGGTFGFGSGGEGGFGSSGQTPADPNSSSGGTSNGSGSEGSGAPADTSAIAAKAAPALVDVTSTFGYQSSEGAGTGIVLTSTGEILTNNHVIDGATKISVTDVGNGKTYGASVVGYDSSHDIAVLQLQGASGLTTAALGDSAKAAVGQSVVAIGNAGGTGGTPSSAGGSITALNQPITANNDLDGTAEQLTGLIEVNADVQPGDSGGALVNTSGQVIGMDTAASEGFSMRSSDQSSGNQGFAIPIDQARATAQQIEAGHGTAVIHVGPAAFLGVMISSSDSQGGQGSGGSGGFGGGSTSSGATVSGVVDGTSAQQAGLSAGDVITSFGGQAVDSATTLNQLMVGHHPGDQVQLGWVDESGQSHTATVDLGTGPPA